MHSKPFSVFSSEPDVDDPLSATGGLKEVLCSSLVKSEWGISDSVTESQSAEDELNEDDEDVDEEEENMAAALDSLAGL